MTLDDDQQELIEITSRDISHHLPDILNGTSYGKKFVVVRHRKREAVIMSLEYYEYFKMCLDESR